MRVEYLIKCHKKRIALSSLLLTLGLTLITANTIIYKFIMHQVLSLSPSSISYSWWNKNPMPLYLDVYIFNWTNPGDIYNHSIKPSFVEVGPFRFKETREKVNITWNSNETVSYWNRKTWIFDREQSAFGLDVNVTTLNPVSVSAAFIARYWNYFLKRGILMMLRMFAPQIHVNRPVGDILIKGYDDALVSLSKFYPALKKPQNMDRFGYLYTRNHSELEEGYYNMHLGRESFGQMHNWNYNNRTNVYHDECGKVSGSAGELYLPPKDKTNISFFCADFCRSLTLDFAKEEETLGLTGYKYIADESFLDNGTRVPKNACYFNGDQVPYGQLNLSACQYGSPTFISLPHFYKADPYYIDQIEGMKPSKSLHEFYMTLEPNSGIPISVAARLQLNILLQPVPDISLFERVPKIYLPIFWVQQAVDLPIYIVLFIKVLLKLPLICQTFGCILILCSLWIFSKAILDTKREGRGLHRGRLSKKILLSREDSSKSKGYEDGNEFTFT